MDPQVTTARDVVDVFRFAGEKWGLPAALLTDNGCVFTAWRRGGATVLEYELAQLGIEFRHSRIYHPQTCGKVERFHQTLKIFLARQPRAGTIAELQSQIDRFVTYYNEVRPHRSRGRVPPMTAYLGRDEARPGPSKITFSKQVRVRHDRADKDGKLTLRRAGRLHHIGIGVENARKRVVMLIDGLDVRVLTTDGELLRRLTLDPSRDYQPMGRKPGPPKGRLLGPRKKKPPTMS